MKCPMPHVSWDWVDEGTFRERRQPLRSFCGEDLFLVVEGHLDLDCLDATESIQPEDMFKGADGISWKVQCAQSHVLCVSNYNDGYPADPFKMDELLKLGPTYEDLLVLRDITKALAP